MDEIELWKRKLCYAVVCGGLLATVFFLGVLLSAFLPLAVWPWILAVFAAFGGFLVESKVRVWLRLSKP